MGYQDRSYYRDSGRGGGNPVLAFLSSSVPFFTAFGIRVRIHMSLILLMVLVLLFGLGQGYTWQDRLLSMGVLFTIILLHEFGHCFAARSVGGEAHDILMWPLGGLAMAVPPRRPWPTFVTVAGGPMVNVAICAICGAFLYFGLGHLPWNPWRFESLGQIASWYSWGWYVEWIYRISWVLLLFNLMPIFPLDGGQMLQSILWPWFGYYKSMKFAAVTGMVGAVIGGAVAIVTLNFMLAFLAYAGFMTCLNIRRQLQEAGPWGFQEEDSVNYSASLAGYNEPVRNRASKRAIRKAQQREAEDRDLQEKVDRILEKVSQHGMHSLTWWEKRTLRRATEKQRQRDVEMKRR